jgi:hypothetical protein
VHQHPAPLRVLGAIMAKPCLDCGRTSNASRCAACESTRNIARHGRRTHYLGDYRQRREALRKIAKATDAPCWLCTGSIDYEAHGSDPWSFSADHVEAGRATSPLMPSHRRCNESRGARIETR